MDANSLASSGTRSSKKLKGKKWEPLQLPADDVLESMSVGQLHDMRLPSGYTLRFFPHDMRHMYTAPSKRIHLTKGVVDYIREHNQLGPNKTKTKLFLCTVFERTSACENGFMCREVHCDLKVSQSRVRSLAPPPNASGNRSMADVDEATNPLFDLDTHGLDASAGPASNDNNEFGDSIVSSMDGGESTSSSTSHILKSALMLVVDPNEDELVCTAVHMRSAAEDAHPRLPPGVTYRLALPNMQSPIDEVPSERVFVTKGAKDYYDQVIAGEIPTMNMQHCAHFSKNGMCCFGSDCQFVHVAQYHRRGSGAADSESSGADSGSERDSRRSKGSRSSSASSNKQKHRRAIGSSENPLSLDDHMKSVVVGVQPNPSTMFATHQQQLQMHHHQVGGHHVMLTSQNIANLNQFQQQQLMQQHNATHPQLHNIVGGGYGVVGTSPQYGGPVFATVGGMGMQQQQQPQGVNLQAMPSPSLTSPPSYVPLPQQQQQRVVYHQQPQPMAAASGGQPTAFYTSMPQGVPMHLPQQQQHIMGTGSGGRTSPQQAPLWVAPPSPQQQPQQQPMYYMIPQQQQGSTPGTPQMQGGMQMQQQPYYVINNAQQQPQQTAFQQPLPSAQPNNGTSQQQQQQPQPQQQFVQFSGGPFYQPMQVPQQSQQQQGIPFQPSLINSQTINNSPQQQQQQRMVVIGGARPPPGYQPQPQQQPQQLTPTQQTQPQQHFFY